VTITEVVVTLIPSAIAIVASLVVFWLVRRETRKTAALVAEMKESLRLEMDEQTRRARELSAEASNVPLPEDVKQQAADLVRGAFKLFGEHSKELAEELADFNKQQQRAEERIDRGARRTKTGVI
jgi:uncharacterized protein YoxC